MIDLIKNSLNFKLTEAVGIDVSFISANEFVANIVLLKRTKEKVEVTDSFKGITNFENIYSQIKNIPVFVSVNGKGVFHKEINNDVLEDGHVISAILPNAKQEDFYLQITPNSEEKSFVSLLRKDTVDKLLKSLQLPHVYVCGVGIGPFATNYILPLIDEKNEINQVGYYRVEFRQDQIESFKFEGINKDDSGRTSIAGTLLPKEMILAFAVAFKPFVEDEEDDIGIEMLASNRDELKQRKIFRKSGIAVLAVFFCVLLLNFFLFTHYSSKYNEIYDRLAHNEVLLTKIANINKQMKATEAFLSGVGEGGISKISFYVDQIAHLLHKNVELDEILFNPLKRRMKVDEYVEFERSVILVKGKCIRSTDLNEWTKELKRAEWCSDIEVVNYIQETAIDPGEFEIKLLIH